ncbi:YVTN family beta-propeller protein [Oxalobacteraceae bacterium GrIS 1.18]
MKSKLKLSLMMFALSGSVFAAPPDYKLVDTIKIGGAARWDYIYMDSGAQRLYVTHGTQTEVIDTGTDKVIGTIADTQGVHGVAIATDLGVGFTSNGATDTVAVFDLKTLTVTRSIKVGNKPDAILYLPATHKVVTYNGQSKDVSIIDARTMKVVATVKVPGVPEFSAAGADGNVYFNLEDTGQIASINMTSYKLKKPVSLKPCEEPTGLAIDDKQRLYSVCANSVMMVTSTGGKVLGQVPIGSGPDGVAVMDGYAFSANGRDGTVTVVGEVDGKFQPVATIPTQVGARTIAVDPAAHRIYLPTADYGPAKGEERPPGIADTFRVLVLQKQ